MRAVSMPRIGRNRTKERKVVFSQSKWPADRRGPGGPERGIYYAFPFLARDTTFEQLALRWADVDFERNVIIDLQDAGAERLDSNVTKTDAGMREVPMTPTLRRMLLEWRIFVARASMASSRASSRLPASFAHGPLPARAAAGRSSTTTSERVSGSCADAPRPALCDAAQRSAFVHIDPASAGR